MQVTLAYDVSVGLQDPVAAAVRIGAIPLSQEWEFLQLDQVSDTAVPGAGKVTRTIVLQTNPTSDAMFPTADELKAATRKLCSGVLSLAGIGQVTASDPTVP